MIPIKENRAEPIQWKFISDLQAQQQQQQTQQQHTNKMDQTTNIKSKQFKQQKTKSKCPIHSLKKEDGQIAKILLKNDTNKLIPSKTASIELNSAGSSPTSSVSSKYSSSITSSSLSSCSKLIAKSCKSALSPASSSSHQPTKSKLNGYYSRSLSNLTTSTDFMDGFSLTSTSTINFTRNKSTSNLNLELASSQLTTTPEQTTPEQTASSSTDDDSSTLEKVKSNKYATIYVNLSNRESLGCSVVKGPSTCPGIFIQTIKQNGVAQKAGLEVGDQIISLNDLSCLPEHMQFSEAVEKIKSSKQMKFKVKKNTAISLFLEQTLTTTTTTNKLNRKLTEKTIPLNDISSSSSCNESSSPVGHVSSAASTNYSRRSSKSHFNSCNSHLPYYMNKFSSRHNINANNNTSSSSPNNNYIKSQFSQLPEKSSSRSSLSGSSKRSLRKNIAHHRSYTSLLSSNNSTYGQRMNGYHSPVCLRHSSSNYYSQSENDYSMYELEEHNEKKKIDLIVKNNGDKFISAKSRNGEYNGVGYCKNNSRQFKSKSIRNLNRSGLYVDDCDKCSCLNYYVGSDCNEFDFHKKTAPFSPPIKSNLLKQKLLCNNLSCSNLTFKSQTDIGLSNCQQLCTMLNKQMNALQFNHLTEEVVKSKSTLELNEDLILNNKLYEKMRLEKERLAIERKKLETEQLRLQEEKDKFEREKKQMETMKQHEELKSISSSSTISNTSATATSHPTAATQSIGFLDEIKKLAERRTCDNALITDTLNKTRFNLGAELKGAVRLLPIADGKIKHTDDEKRKQQHDALMQEFREAHQKMFGLRTNRTSNKPSDSDPIETSSKPVVVSSVTSSNVSASVSTTSTMICTTAKNQSNLEKSSDCKETTALKTEIDSSSNGTNVITKNVSTSVTTNHHHHQKIISPPPLPPSMTLATNSTLANGQQQADGKFRKLNTFGKLVQAPEQQRNALPNNVLPKNNLNGLNQTETVKILRTSSPNKKGPAPPPPIMANDKHNPSKLSKVKEEKITFRNGAVNANNNSIFLKNQPKLEKNGSVADHQSSNKYTTDHLVEKANYLSKTASDISLSSLSIKVQVPTK